MVINKITRNDILKLTRRLGVDLNNFIDDIPLFDIYADRNPEWEYGQTTEKGIALPRREFYRDYIRILSCVYDIFDLLGIKTLYVIPLYPYRSFLGLYDNTKDIVSELRHILTDRNINLDSKTGFEVDVHIEKNVIEAILEASFRDYLHILLLSEERKCIIEPSHHFSIRYYMEEADFDAIRVLVESNDVELFLYESKNIPVPTFYACKAFGNIARCVYCYKKITNTGYMHNDGFYMCEKCKNKYSGTIIKIE